MELKQPLLEAPKMSSMEGDKLENELYGQPNFGVKLESMPQANGSFDKTQSKDQKLENSSQEQKTSFDILLAKRLINLFRIVLKSWKSSILLLVLFGSSVGQIYLVSYTVNFKNDDIDENYSEAKSLFF